MTTIETRDTLFEIDKDTPAELLDIILDYYNPEYPDNKVLVQVLPFDKTSTLFQKLKKQINRIIDRDIIDTPFETKDVISIIKENIKFLSSKLDGKIIDRDIVDGWIAVMVDEMIPLTLRQYLKRNPYLDGSDEFLHFEHKKRYVLYTSKFVGYLTDIIAGSVKFI